MRKPGKKYLRFESKLNSRLLWGPYYEGQLERYSFRFFAFIFFQSYLKLIYHYCYPERLWTCYFELSIWHPPASIVTGFHWSKNIGSSRNIYLNIRSKHQLYKSTIESKSAKDNVDLDRIFGEQKLPPDWPRNKLISKIFTQNISKHY